MSCFNCGSGNVTVFFVEAFPCTHCGSANEIVYNMCQDCNTAFKTSGDHLVSSAKFTGEELAELSNLTSKDIAELLKDVPPRSMSEVIHRCLKCNSVAYEIGEEYYKCPICDFSWGTV